LPVYLTSKLFLCGNASKLLLQIAYIFKNNFVKKNISRHTLNKAANTFLLKRIKDFTSSNKYVSPYYFAMISSEKDSKGLMIKTGG